jgi:hypothetical protein
MNYFTIKIERRRMIQTSYYQKSGCLPNAVGISQGVPKWYTGALYKKLAPPWEIVKIENEATFRRLYYKMVLLPSRQVGVFVFSSRQKKTEHVAGTFQDLTIASK